MEDKFKFKLGDKITHPKVSEAVVIKEIAMIMKADRSVDRFYRLKWKSIDFWGRAQEIEKNGTLIVEEI